VSFVYAATCRALSSELSEAEIMAKTFRGINQRALHVVGAQMAGTIDDGALGRETLARTVTEGPRSFVATFKRVAEPALRLVEVPDLIGSPRADAPRCGAQGRLRTGPRDGQRDACIRR
jgi:hypothetical protein